MLRLRKQLHKLSFNPFTQDCPPLSISPEVLWICYALIIQGMVKSIEEAYLQFIYKGFVQVRGIITVCVLQCKRQDGFKLSPGPLVLCLRPELPQPPWVQVFFRVLGGIAFGSLALVHHPVHEFLGRNLS